MAVKAVKNFTSKRVECSGGCGFKWSFTISGSQYERKKLFYDNWTCSNCAVDDEPEYMAKPVKKIDPKDRKPVNGPGLGMVAVRLYLELQRDGKTKSEIISIIEAQKKQLLTNPLL